MDPPRYPGNPVFKKIIEEERVERVPVLKVLKWQPKQVTLTALLRLPEEAPGYIVGAWIFTYATHALGQSRDFVLLAVITQTVLGFIWVVIAGWLSDVVGRKNMFIIGCVSMGVFGFIYIGMLNTGIPAPALQRIVARLSTRLRHRRRSVAVHLDVVVRDV